MPSSIPSDRCSDQEGNTYTGTHTVGPDCTVSAELSSSSGLELPLAGVIAGEGVRQAVHVLIAQRGLVFVAAIDRQ